MEWEIFGSAFTISFLLIVFLGEDLRQKRKIMLREIQQNKAIAPTSLDCGADELVGPTNLFVGNCSRPAS